MSRMLLLVGLFLGTSSGASLRAKPPVNCQSGFNPPDGTGCPNPTWVDAMVQTDPSPQKVIMSIGCNVGDDAMKWMERWDMSQSWSAKQWEEHIKEHMYHGCYTGHSFQRAAAINAHAAKKSAAPTVVCVEPMRANVELLRSTSLALGYGPKAKFGSFQIVEAAVLDKAAPNQTIDFPDARPGISDKGVQHSKGPAEKTTAVPVQTVDGIVANLKLSKVDILLVDTEGWDPAVLRGALSTLAHVRYLEFEVHRGYKHTEWSRTPLRSVMEELDQQGFDCYWAGDNGRLLSMNRCWSDAFEAPVRGNAACVKRNDPWSASLQHAATA